MQIQQGMETLRQTVPSVMNTLGVPPFPSLVTTTGTSPTNTQTTATTVTTAPSAGGGNTTTTTASTPQSPPTNDSFSEVCLLRLLNNYIYNR